MGQVADKLGLTSVVVAAGGAEAAAARARPGWVIRDLAVMLADGGECVWDLGALRDQEALFGEVASDSTAFRVVSRAASTPGLLDVLRVRTRGRGSGSGSSGAPERLTIEIDAR